LRQGVAADPLRATDCHGFGIGRFGGQLSGVCKVKVVSEIDRWQNEGLLGIRVRAHRSRVVRRPCIAQLWLGDFAGGVARPGFHPDALAKGCK
jgi:hypothetical protein